MAVDKLVDSTQLDADLTAVADAIRLKGGTSADLAFPADFVSAIGDISAGGGYTADDIAAGITGEITLTGDGLIGKAYAFYKQSGITKVIAPNMEGTLGGNVFEDCTGLTSIYIPNATGFGATSFKGCTNLTVVVLQNGRNCYTACFQNCTKLTAIDFGGSGSASDSATFNANGFNGDTELSTLIIRNTGRVAALANVSCFTNTPFANGKAGGTLYVPSALVSSYQSASNWSTILGYGSGAQNQILPIEGSVYETQYADGTPIT